MKIIRYDQMLIIVSYNELVEKILKMMCEWGSKVK